MQPGGDVIGTSSGSKPPPLSPAANDRLAPAPPPHPPSLQATTAAVPPPSSSSTVAAAARSPSSQQSQEPVLVAGSQALFPLQILQVLQPLSASSASSAPHGDAWAIGAVVDVFLNAEVWASFSKEEQASLTALLPSAGRSVDVTLKALLGGSSSRRARLSRFGVLHPVEGFCEALGRGEFHPRISKWRDGLRQFERREFMSAIRRYHDKFVRRISINNQQQTLPQPPPIHKTSSQPGIDKRKISNLSKPPTDGLLSKKRPLSSSRKPSGAAAVKKHKEAFASGQETPLFTAAHDAMALAVTSISLVNLRKHLSESAAVKRRLIQLGIGLDGSYVAPLLLRFMKAPRNIRSGKMVQPFVARESVSSSSSSTSSGGDNEQVLWKWIRPVVATNEPVEMSIALKKGSALNRDVIKDMLEMEDQFMAILRGAARGATTKKSGNAAAELLNIFHVEERLRFAMPELPFTYGETRPGQQKCPVAPIRKEAQKAGGKPREHNLLISSRPAHVSVLAIMRDAAARLDGFIGDKNKVLEKAKESQYLLPGAPMNKLSSLVGNALDRLHSASDPCVKYDTENKVWAYLHGDRAEESLVFYDIEGCDRRPRKPGSDDSQLGLCGPMKVDPGTQSADDIVMADPEEHEDSHMEPAPQSGEPSDM